MENQDIHPFQVLVMMCSFSYNHAMDIIHAIILGAIEGLTEFLPVSSTGHLMITADLLGIPDTTVLKTFEIAIQLGAVIAVIILFPRRLFLDRAAMLRIAAAFIPTGILGLLLHHAVETYLFGNMRVILWALLGGGIAIILIEHYLARRSMPGCDIADLPITRAGMIGIVQAIAFVPGVSRSAATILGGILLGLSRTAAVEFSFLVAVPVMVAATGLDLVRSASEFSGSDWVNLAIGSLTALGVAAGTILFLLRYVRTHTLTPFAYYRILLAILLFFIIF